MRADPGASPATEFTKACLSDSMYCPLGPGSDEEVREGTPNIGAYHCPNPMDYVIQGTTHGGWDRKKAGFASASFELPNSFVSLSSGVGQVPSFLLDFPFGARKDDYDLSKGEALQAS